MSFFYRPAIRKDCKTVARMVAALLCELAPGYVPDTDAMATVADELLTMPTVTGILALDGDAPVGLIMLNECAAIYCGGRFGEITELYVSPDYRSRGIAAALVAQATAEGQRRGWKRLEVGAPSQPLWDRTLHFYLREGFAEVGPRLRRIL